MNCNNEQETMGRFRPMTRYLSDKTGVEFEMVPVDTNDFEGRFKKGEFAFTQTNSILYVILREHYDLKLLASEKRGPFGSRTAGTITARTGSGITKLSDLREKRLALGPMLAPAGHLAEYDLMLRNGLNPDMIWQTGPFQTVLTSTKRLSAKSCMAKSMLCSSPHP